MHATDQPAAYSALLDWGLRLTLMLALPASLALALLAVPLISTLFLHGAFTANDLAQTQLALVAYSVGLTGLILVKVLAPGYYARQNIRKPVRIAILSLVITQVFNLLLVGPLAHAGLALSIGLAACVNAGMLLHGLLRDGIYTPLAGWLPFLSKLLLALAAMGTALAAAIAPTGSWSSYAPLERVGLLAMLVALGIAVYFITLGLLGFRLRDFRRRATD